MKKIARIISLLIALTLSLGAIWLFASADTGTPRDSSGSMFESEFDIPESVSVTAGGELASAGSTYVLYEDEAAFLSDVEGGVVDGLNALGETVGVGKTAADDFPSEGYMCLLANFSYEKIYNTNGILSINLNGKTYTVKLPNRSETVSTVTGTLSIFNGTLKDSFGYKHPTIKVNDGSILNIRDVTINVTTQWETNSSFFGLYAATANLENVRVDHTGMQTSVLKGCAGKTSINLKGVTYNGTMNHSTYGSDGAFSIYGAYFGFIQASGGDLIVTADKDTAISGSYFVNKNSKSSKVELNLEIGFKMNFADFTNGYAMNDADKPTKSWNVATTVNYFENGEAVVGVPRFCLGDDGLYSLCWATLVYWHDVHGEVEYSEALSIGTVPAPKNTETTLYLFEDGGLYIYKLDGYSSEPDGEKTEFTKIEQGDPDRHYYRRVSDSAAAAVAVFDAEGGNLLDAWAEKSITKEQLGKIPAEAYVLLYSDIEMAPKATTAEDAVLDNTANKITFDLGGFTMTHVNDGDIHRYWSFTSKKTLYFVNGTMAVVGDGSLSELYASASILELTNVNITSSGEADVFKVCGGGIKILSCSVDTPNATVAAIKGSGSTAAPNIKVFLHGSYVKAKTVVSIESAKTLKNTFEVQIYDKDDIPTVVEAERVIYFDSLCDMLTTSKIAIKIKNLFATVSQGLLTRNPDESAWATWYDSKTNTSTSDPSLDASKIITTVTESLYSTKELLPAKTDTIEIKDIVKQNISASEGGYTVAYSLARSPKLWANLTLYSDFYLNIYIPKTSGISKVFLNGEVVFDLDDPTTYRLHGDDFYVFTIAEIAPNFAASLYKLEVLCDGEVAISADKSIVITYVNEFKYSVVNYLSDLLTDSSESETVKNLAKATAAYVKASYGYFVGGEADGEIMSLLDSIIDTYAVDEFVSSFEVSTPAADTDLDPSLGVTAYFEVGAKTKLRLDFAQTTLYSILDSKGNVVITAEGDSCVITLPAYMLTEVYTVCVGGESATFGFAEYADILIGDENTDEDEAIHAMYAYGLCAAALKAELMPDGTL